MLGARARVASARGTSSERWRLAAVPAARGARSCRSARRASTRLAGAYRAQEEVLYLWSGEHVRRLVPGLRGPRRRRLLAAHRPVLRRPAALRERQALRAAGARSSTSPPPSTRASEIAYRYGAIFLSEPRPLGAGRPEDGVAVLEKGVRGDARRLAAAPGPRLLPLPLPARRAGRVAGAARGRGDPRRGLLAAPAGGEPAGQGRRPRQLAPHVGSRCSSRPRRAIIRDNARSDLQILDSLDRADALRARVAASSSEAHGRRPARLEELAAAGSVARPARRPGRRPVRL